MIQQFLFYRLLHIIDNKEFSTEFFVYFGNVFLNSMSIDIRFI